MRREKEPEGPERPKTARETSVQVVPRAELKESFVERLREALSTPVEPVAPVGVDDADVTPMAPPPAGWEVLAVRPLQPPYSFARLLRDPATNESVYEVLEPPLTPTELATYAFVRDAFVRTVDVDLAAVERSGPRAYMRSALLRILDDYRLDATDLGRKRLLYYVERDFLGYGALEPFMHDPDIEDVSCNGPGLPMFVYHRRHESMRTTVLFPTHDDLDAFVMELVQRCGKQISVSDPVVDATLPDGSRLQATLAREVSTRGSTFTVRRFRDDPFTPVDLLTLGSANAEMLAYFWLAVEHGASGLFCGGTASGKTTLLNALSLFIPSRMKIVSIEDTREINLPHDNWIPGLTRGVGVGEKVRGEVDMFDLLKAALRQRPEFILVGEIRGREAYVLFQAMATGHTVYSTMHADSAPSTVYRLESKPIEVPRIMLTALDFVSIMGQVRVGGKRVRRIQEVVEFTSIDTETGELHTNTVFRWDAATDSFRPLGYSHVVEKIARQLGRPVEHVRQEIDRRRRLLEAAAARGLRDYKGFAALVNAYDSDPDRALAELGVGAEEKRAT